MVGYVRSRLAPGFGKICGISVRDYYFLFHPSQGEDNQEYYLGLTPSGIIVLRNKNIVGNYYWPRISKIYFKGRYFMLRVTGKNVSSYTSANCDILSSRDYF